MTRVTSEPLVLTGERTVPGVERETYWFRRHEAAYAWAATHLPLTGARVVEAGSGEGFGAAMLRAAGADVVLALEYDAPAVAHAARTYPAVSCVRANLADLPVADGGADVVATLQVVEHLWDLRGFLLDCARVLRPGGTLLVTTPNRLTFSPGLGRGEKPTNPFHVEEFDPAQLAALVAGAGFDDVVVRGLRHGPRLVAEELTHGSIVAAQVDAVLADAWDDGLTARVAQVALEDFVVDGNDVARSLDLLVTAVRP
jgi:SAM-dependent methyltransferase